ncbi:uncharacterized protein LOC144654536 [Oculina patagonica]
MHLLMFTVFSLFALYRKCHGQTADQCPAQLPIYDKALKGYTFKTVVSSSAFDCLVHCHYEDRCQSYNYVIKTSICEMNNRTKEAKPEQFVSDPDRFYMKRGAHRKPLGSIPSLPAQSCKEIKANEGGQAVSGNSWLDPTRSGEVILAYCDMNTEVADFCIRHRCLNGATCVNERANYTCLCYGVWTGTYCESSIAELDCHDIKKRGLSQGDGLYWLDPDGGSHSNAFLAYCDMTSYNGGWTMCYTTDEYVKPRTEVTYSAQFPHGTDGYRTDCNNIPFTEIIFIDHQTGAKVYFKRQTNHSMTAAANYGNGAGTYGLWDGVGASDAYSYQLLICDHWFYSGYFVSGYTDNCYKICENWCGDKSSPYFRTAASEVNFKGVAFNTNGHRPNIPSNRLISVGLR